jgi:hypothetical protein
VIKSDVTKYYEESTTKVEELISTRVSKQVKLQKKSNFTRQASSIKTKKYAPNPTLGQMKAGIKSLTN